VCFRKQGVARRTRALGVLYDLVVNDGVLTDGFQLAFFTVGTGKIHCQPPFSSMM